MITGLIIGLVIGAVAATAATLGYHFQAKTDTEAETRTMAARFVDLQAMHVHVMEELERTRQGLAAAEQARAALSAEILTVRRVAEDREVQRQTDRDSFAELSRVALERNREEFWRTADERMSPLKDTLVRYEEQLRAMEKDRQVAYATLTKTVGELHESQTQLQKETRNLVSALRSPTTRGRWGEVQLRRVVEMAGMIEHCDFDEQVVTPTEDGRLRPDMVVHLPGGGEVVVDAKVPLDAYLRAIEAEDDVARGSALEAHARQLRTHVDQMAKREYWKHVDGSTEQVVVFIPGDSLLGAAYEVDPNLQEYAMSCGVLLTTPTTLIALLRTVAYGWRQETLAERAKEVEKLGNELYERLKTMGGHLMKLQSHLTQTVRAFNSAVGSFEGRVMVSARKFPEMGVGRDDLPQLESVEAVARIPLDDPD